MLKVCVGTERPGLGPATALSLVQLQRPWPQPSSCTVPLRFGWQDLTCSTGCAAVSCPARLTRPGQPGLVCLVWGPVHRAWVLQAWPVARAAPGLQQKHVAAQADGAPLLLAWNMRPCVHPACPRGAVACDAKQGRGFKPGSALPQEHCASVGLRQVILA